jgi:predicted DNA-binding transcriptional regulator AlpA
VATVSFTEVYSMSDRVISYAEAASRAGLSLATFRRLLDRREGPPVIDLSPRRRGVRESSFETWLNTRTRAVESQAAA